MKCLFYHKYKQTNKININKEGYNSMCKNYIKKKKILKKQKKSIFFFLFFFFNNKLTNFVL